VHNHNVSERRIQLKFKAEEPLIPGQQYSPKSERQTKVIAVERLHDHGCVDVDSPLCQKMSDASWNTVGTKMLRSAKHLMETYSVLLLHIALTRQNHPFFGFSGRTEASMLNAIRRTSKDRFWPEADGLIADSN
jgi:hypothetical protein